MLESLDVAIGLIVVYLVLALACTALNEGIAAYFAMRSKTLKGSIDQMLGSALSANFYKHPLIKSLCEGDRNPAYIPATAFRMVLLDLLDAPATGGTASDIVDKAGDHPELKKALNALSRDAAADVQKFADEIEAWFNSSMERVGGWYKRKVQRIIVAIAVVVTIACNADTIEMARRLSQDDALRDAMVARAQTIAKDANAAGRDPKAEIKEIEKLGLPLGWGGDWDERYPDWDDCGFGSFNFAISKFAGLLVTALAVSLGAPFWFDMLNKVVTVRAAGRAPEERPKKPQDHPKRWS